MTRYPTRDPRHGRAAPFAISLAAGCRGRCEPAAHTGHPLRWLGGHSEGQHTRSHPELGRENPQRQWYCVLRRGRVGRCQAFQADAPAMSRQAHGAARQLFALQRAKGPRPSAPTIGNAEGRTPTALRAAKSERENTITLSNPVLASPSAGWSSPVARQAHNLKVRGSNPLPATKRQAADSENESAAFHV